MLQVLELELTDVAISFVAVSMWPKTVVDRDTAKRSKVNTHQFTTSRAENFWVFSQLLDNLLDVVAPGTMHIDMCWHVYIPLSKDLCKPIGGLSPHTIPLEGIQISLKTQV